MREATPMSAIRGGMLQELSRHQKGYENEEIEQDWQEK